MRFLAVHPEDSPLSGPWVKQRWEAVFDLARCGWAACERWSGAFGCPVKPIDALRNGSPEMGRVRELLRMGLGRVVDREGLDWWELNAIMVHQHLERLVLLRMFANQIPADGEAWITREGFEADALRRMLGSRLHVISSEASRQGKGAPHYLRRLQQLPIAQVVQVLGDKYDAGYRVRRHLRSRAERNDEPVVLVPSSYINMSLTGVAYARLVPDTNFLLVATRSSGRVSDLSCNARQEWLAAYAGDSGAEEYSEILPRWLELKNEIQSVPELATLSDSGLMDDFPKRIRDGLAIRNAWLRVFRSERVQAVLCCDDSNPHTHIPLLLAQRHGLPTIACHHGAFDGRQLFKTNHADVILAKGRMEWDYLVRECGIDPSLVEIGAPNSPRLQGARNAAADWIVFFSEPYEMTAGRTEEIYRDVLPGLSELARSAGKQLVIKLHPSENLADRRNMAQRVLTPENARTVQWITGRFGPELLQRTWFGLTVQSSVAMECLVHGVPCFLCDWLDLWPYGYIGQYQRFGVGIGLNAPAEIAKIPEKLADYRPNPSVAADCWQAIAPERLRELLSGRRAAAAVPTGMQRAQ